MKQRFFNNKFLNSIFASDIVEAFMFCVLCATVFTSVMCHWILDVGYKYIVTDTTLSKVDFSWAFGIVGLVIIYYLIRNRRAQFDFSLALLCQVFVLVGVMDYHSERYDVIPYAWILPTAYMLGKVVGGYEGKNSNQRIVTLYFSMAIAAFITTLLDFLMNYKYSSMFGFQTEKWVSFWLGGIWENRCTYEFGFILLTTTT